MKEFFFFSSSTKKILTTDLNVSQVPSVIVCRRIVFLSLHLCLCSVAGKCTITLICRYFPSVKVVIFLVLPLCHYTCLCYLSVITLACYLYVITLVCVGSLTLGLIVLLSAITHVLHLLCWYNFEKTKLKMCQNVSNKRKKYPLFSVF